MEAASVPPVRHFPFLQLPYEVRRLIYNFALSTTISITDSRLSRSPTLEEVSFLVSRRRAWDICLCSRFVYSESVFLRWENLIITLSKDGTADVEDDGRHRLGNADQALRRKIRHIHVTDPSCYGLCYGMMHCFNLRTLTISIEEIDGIFPDKGGGNLVVSKPKGALQNPRRRRLRLEIQQVEQLKSTASGMRMILENNAQAQIQWRRRWAAKADWFPFVFLSDLIPNLPPRCLIVLQLKASEVTLRFLREFRGFEFVSVGQNRWNMTYKEEI